MVVDWVVRNWKELIDLLVFSGAAAIGVSVLVRAFDEASKVCFVCLVRHERFQPHSPNAFFKSHYKKVHGREPSWADAAEHCPEAIKNFWNDHNPEKNK